jgi:cysteine desulfurase
VQLNGSAEARVPHNLNVSFPPTRYGTLGSQLLGIAVSAGSACNSAASAPSFVLLAIGRSPDVARNAVRFSLGRGTTEAEIDYVVATVRQVLAHEVDTAVLAEH